MENNREAGQFFFDFLQNVKTKLRFLTGFKFVSAVACADGDCQRVNAGSGHEIINLFGFGEVSIFRADVDVIFNTGKLAEFAFHDNAAGMRIVHDLFGQGNVFFIRQVATVDHDGSKAAVDAGFAGLKIRAVVQVQRNRQTGFFSRRFDHSDKIAVGSVFSCAGGNLQNHRGVVLFRSTGDTLNDFHVVDVESADGIAAFISFFEHFGCGY